MEFEKKVDVLYISGEKTEHTFRLMSGDDRDRIFGKYLDMEKFMAQGEGAKDENPMKFIKPGENILGFTSEILKASCPILKTNEIPSFELDRLFAELNDFIMTGGLKNSAPTSEH